MHPAWEGTSSKGPTTIHKRHACGNSRSQMGSGTHAGQSPCVAAGADPPWAPYVHQCDSDSPAGQVLAGPGCLLAAWEQAEARAQSQAPGYQAAQAALLRATLMPAAAAQARSLPRAPHTRQMHFPLPDDFSTRPFGFLGSFYLYRYHLRDRLLDSCIFIAQKSCLLRKIHVLHKRHAALQS